MSDVDFPSIITVEELTSLEDSVRLADVRWYLDGRSGLAAYQGGHLPGARFVDLDEVLSEPGEATAGRHPLPSPAQFATGLAAAGIGEDLPVVAYDDSGGGTAGRLVWMLRSLGEPAAVLSGGIAAYSGMLEVGDPDPTPAMRQVQPWPADLLSELDSLDEIDDASVVLDARASERYRGEIEPIDPRPGHLPMARNLPWTELLDESGAFLSSARIRERFLAEGIGDGARLIASCGSGVTACALLVAAEHAGLGRGRLYVPSYSGWSNSDRPVSLGL